MSEPRGPVFVAGCPRSGTSALSWAIAAHPGYWSSAETHFFYYLLRRDASPIREAFERSSGSGQWLDRHGVDFAGFLAHLGHGLDRMMRAQSGGRQWVDGSPENLMVGELLLQMFPTARIFVVVRDPRAVCYSMLTSGFAAPWASDVGLAIREWMHYARIGWNLARTQRERVIEVKQEAMRSSAAAVAGRIAEALQLGEPARIAEFLDTRTVNSSRDRSTYTVGSPFSAAPRAELSRAEFLDRHEARIMREAGEFARLYGYA